MMNLKVLDVDRAAYRAHHILSRYFQASPEISVCSNFLETCNQARVHSPKEEHSMLFSELTPLEVVLSVAMLHGVMLSVSTQDV